MVGFEGAFDVCCGGEDDSLDGSSGTVEAACDALKEAGGAQGDVSVALVVGGAVVLGGLLGWGCAGNSPEAVEPALSYKRPKQVALMIM